MHFLSESIIKSKWATFLIDRSSNEFKSFNGCTNDKFQTRTKCQMRNLFLMHTTVCPWLFNIQFACFSMIAIKIVWICVSFSLITKQSISNQWLSTKYRLLFNSQCVLYTAPIFPIILHTRNRCGKECNAL